MAAFVGQKRQRKIKKYSLSPLVPNWIIYNSDKIFWYREVDLRT